MRKVVRPRLAKAALLRSALGFFGEGRWVSGKQVEILLGLFTHEALYCRPSLSIFRAAYTFVQDSYFIKQKIWPSVARELAVARGLIPIICTHLDLPWAETIKCTDAAPNGWGVCSAPISSSAAKALGQWSEQWRYRRLQPDEWAPRRRALEKTQHPDVLSDPQTLGGQLCNIDGEPLPSEFGFVEREGFPEIRSVEHLDWHVERHGRFRLREHIGVKEARVVCWDLERTLRDPSTHRHHHVRLCDNFGVVLSLTKGRAKSFGILQICRRVACLALATGCMFHYRWVASELNPADEPSRRFEHIAIEQAHAFAQGSSHGKDSGSLRALHRLAERSRIWQQISNMYGGISSRGIGQAKNCSVASSRKPDDSASSSPIGFSEIQFGELPEKSAFASLAGKPGEEASWSSGRHAGPARKNDAGRVAHREPESAKAVCSVLQGRGSMGDRAWKESPGRKLGRDIGGLPGRSFGGREEAGRSRTTET